MSWSGRKGPDQQGFLNLGGCSHVILLQKTTGSFQQNSGLMRYTILKDDCCGGNELYVG